MSSVGPSNPGVETLELLGEINGGFLGFLIGILVPFLFPAIRSASISMRGITKPLFRNSYGGAIMFLLCLIYSFVVFLKSMGPNPVPYCSRVG